MVAVLFTGCGKSTPTSAEKGTAEEGTIKLGLLAPLTGTNAEYGKGFQVATQMAADEINAAGGVNGHKLEIVVADSKGDQKESSDLARKFGDDESIMGIIGDFASGCCMANAPIVDAAGIVQLSPTASNPGYTKMSPYCFSIMGRQDVEAPFFAKYIAKKYLNSKATALMYINSDWGKSSRDNFVKGAKEAGLNIVAEANYVQDEKDFSSVISKLKAANPDTVVILDQGAVPQILNQIAQAGWKVQTAALGPGTSEQIIQLCGKNAEGLVTSTPFFFDETNAKQMAFKKTFTEKAGFEPTVHPVCAYDCVYLMAEAIKACGDKITRQAISNNLAKIDYTGLTGEIKFSADRDLSRSYLICAVENGKFVLKEGLDYSKE